MTAGTGGRETYIGDVGWDEVYLASVKTDRWKPLARKSIAAAAQRAGRADVWATIFDLLIDEDGDVAATFECMDDEDIHRIMTDRYTMFATDGWGVAPTGPLSRDVPHPRFYGTYPRLLGRYVREQGLMTLEEAVRKMASFPARRLGLSDRGLLRAGTWADIVVFDPDTVIDRATYGDPHQFSEGVEHVLVNGQIVVENDVQSDVLPGRILRRTGSDASVQ